MILADCRIVASTSLNKAQATHRLRRRASANMCNAINVVDWAEQWRGGITLCTNIAGVALQLRWGGHPPSTGVETARQRISRTGGGRGGAADATFGASDPFAGFGPAVARLRDAVQQAGLDQALADAGEPNSVDASFLAAWLEAAGGDEARALDKLAEHARWRRAVATGAGGRVHVSQVRFGGCAPETSAVFIINRLLYFQIIYRRRISIGRSMPKLPSNGATTGAVA